MNFTTNQQLDYVRNEFYNNPNITQEQKEKLRLQLLKLLEKQGQEDLKEFIMNTKREVAKINE